MRSTNRSSVRPRVGGLVGRLAGVLAAGAAGLAPGAAAAEDLVIDWVASLAVGIKVLEFEEERDGTITDRITGEGIGGTFSNRQTFDEPLYYLDLGIGTAINRYYVAANVEIPFQEVSTSKKFRSANNRFDDRYDIDRLDWSITAGVNVVEGLAVFAGYKYGETDQENTDPGTAAPAQFKQEYEEKGPFIGVSYGLPVADAGLLTFSIAYADLNAEYSERGRFGEPNPPDSTSQPLLGPEEYDGDAEGFSYGARWTGNLGESMQYSFAAKYQKYELDGKGGRVNLTNPNVTGEPAVVFERIDLEIDTTEEILAFTAGIQYVF